MEEINKEAVSNFLASMDMKLSENVHQLNAISDCLSYGWDRETYKEIQKGITAAYSKKAKMK